MKPRLLALVVIVVVGCKSDAEKACFDGTDPKIRVSACGEACESSKGAGSACVMQVELAIDACMKKQNAEVCMWMCHYAPTGADLFCAEYTKITGKRAD